MEGTNEPVWKKVKKNKSATKYPKRSNLLVVAPTQEISGDKNENSKTKGESDIDFDATVKTFTATAKDISPNRFISEVKIDMFDSNQRGDTSKTSLQTKKSQQVKNKMVTGQLKIFNSSSRNLKSRNFSCKRKRQWKNAKGVVILNSVRFKHKKTKIHALHKLEKHYEKIKIDLPGSEEYKNIDIYTISRLVSKSRITKRSTKQNVLGDLHQTSSTDNCSLNYSDTSSLTYSAHSTKTPSSYTSQNTLVRNSIFSMKNDDFCSIKTMNTGTYKTEIINIAVAVGYPPNNEQPTITCDKIYADKENETSAYTISFSDLDMELTSAVPSKDSRMKETIKSSGDSFLLENKTFKKPSDNDTLVGAQTSSSLNLEYESMSISNSVAMSESLPTNNMPNFDEIPIYDKIPKSNTLLNDVMNFGLYPEVRPSTSSGEKNDTVLNNGIATNTYEDLTIDKQSSHNNLEKSIDIQNKSQHSDNSLLNDIAIKALLKDGNKTSANFPGIWEHFTLALNVAISKLEERLADKIIREIRESLLTFRQQRKNETPRAKISLSKMNNKEIKTESRNERVSHKEVFVVEDNFKVENDQCLQCHLVQNHIIDQVMLKLSLEGPKIPSTPKISKKSLPRPEIVRHYFDVIKPSTSDVELGKGDNMVTVSTGTAHTVPESSHRNLQRFPAFVRNPFVFIRENIIVITSVPAFFFVLSCLYVVMSAIVRP